MEMNKGYALVDERGRVACPSICDSKEQAEQEMLNWNEHSVMHTYRVCKIEIVIVNEE